MNREEAITQARKDIEDITETIDAIESGDRPNYRVLYGGYPHYTMSNEVVELADSGGERTYLGAVRGILKMGIESGLPSGYWLPRGMPEYANDLVREE